MIRTFYWHELRRRRLLGRGRGIRIGNAGDLFNRDLVRHVYGEAPDNVSDAGRRLLLVGSTVHRALDGDVICGVGTKGIDPPSDVDALVWGCRGPITLDALGRAGHDVSDVRFIADPGMIVDQVYPDAAATEAERNRVIFIPHYRDRHLHRSNRDYTVVDVDAEPRDLALEIARAEHVYSSSLHGVIFAHALGRPVTAVATDGAEPEIKYEDHYLSLGLPWRRPASIAEASRARIRDDVVTVPRASRSLPFPPRDVLATRGIATGASASADAT